MLVFHFLQIESTDNISQFLCFLKIYYIRRSYKLISLGYPADKRRKYFFLIERRKLFQG